MSLGSKIKIRINAKDISLAKKRPEKSTILNCIEATIIEFSKYHETYVDVLLDVGTPLIARITRKSQVEINFCEGDNVFALVKATAMPDPLYLKSLRVGNSLD